jgi:hypothetical protein
MCVSEKRERERKKDNKSFFSEKNPSSIYLLETIKKQYLNSQTALLKLGPAHSVEKHFAKRCLSDRQLANRYFALSNLKDIKINRLLF